MLEALRSYDKLTADGLIAHTLFSLEKGPTTGDVAAFNNQDIVCSKILEEVSTRLNLKPDSETNIQKIIDSLDSELERSMELDKEKEQTILTKLSNDARLPTDLYKIKTDPSISDLYHVNIAKEYPLIENTIKNPDFVYHFNASELENAQKDISIFAKYYEKAYSFDSFYLLVIGKRDGLDFLVNQAWHIYNHCCPV
ncbi:MAG: hypothetical protein LBQ88_01970 [Treponema sp.]|jgi:hypothetical protein|nr:hypothetical protein [Treponema sp.]